MFLEDLAISEPFEAPLMVPEFSAPFTYSPIYSTPEVLKAAPSSPSGSMTPTISQARATSAGGLSFRATPGAFVELISDGRYIQTLPSSIDGWDAKNAGLWNGGEVITLRPVIDGVYGPDTVITVDGAASTTYPTAMAIDPGITNATAAPSLQPVRVAQTASRGLAGMSPLMLAGLALVLWYAFKD